MKKFLCALAVALLLVGCQKVGSEKKEEAKPVMTEEKVAVREDKEVKDTDVENSSSSELYFEYLVSRYQEAIEYEKKNEGKSVQSPVSALTMAMEELRLKNPEDEATIQKNYQDLLVLLEWRADDFENDMKAFNSSYEKVPLKNFDVKNVIISQLLEMTIGGVKVKNNVLGVVKSNDYRYLILDVYERADNHSLYLLALQDGAPKVLSANTSLDKINNADFVETQEVELAPLFQQYFSQGMSGQKVAEVQSNVDEIIKAYGESVSDVYEEVNLATSGKNYYKLGVPDQVLEYGKVDGQPVIFKWYGWVLGTEGITYEIKAGYINQSGTEVILFCLQGDELVVLHTVGEPRVEKDEAGAVLDAEVNFEKIDNEILREVYFK